MGGGGGESVVTERLRNGGLFYVVATQRAFIPLNTNLLLYLDFHLIVQGV